MAAPVTKILDTFNRADENPLMASLWGSPFGAGHNFAVVSNQCQSGEASFDENRWLKGFAVSHEVYCTLITRPANGTTVALILRGQTATIWDDYYRVHFQANGAGNDSVQIVSVISGTAANVGPNLDLGRTMANGDQLWAQVAESSIWVWYNGTLMGAVSDGGVPAGGFIGLYTDTASGVVIDGFGGGTLSPQAGFGKELGSLGWGLASGKNGKG